MPLTVDSAHIPVCFCYQQQLCLLSLVSDCCFFGLPPWYTLNFTETHRNKSSGFKLGDWECHASPLHLPSQSEVLFSLPECGGVLSWCCMFTLMLQGVHPVNTLVIHFPEYSCNVELQNIPWYYVVLWGYCLIFLSTYELNFVLKVILCYLVWIFLCLRVQIPCFGNIILGKLSLIHGKYVRQNLYLWLQPVTK